MIGNTNIQNGLDPRKERLRLIANRYLPNEDKLPIDCTWEQLIQVFDSYDEYSYMNAFLNSIEVFPDKDYSINDTEGHIKGLRNYAFYGNTALKSLKLNGINAINESWNNQLLYCGSLKELSLGCSSVNITSFNVNILPSLSKLAKLSFPNLLTVTLARGEIGVGTAITELYMPRLNSYTTSAVAATSFFDSPALSNLNLPSLETFNFGSSGKFIKSTAPSLKTMLFGSVDFTCGSFGISNTNTASLQAMIYTGQSKLATLSNSTLVNEIIDTTDVIIYVPSTLLSTYQSATNWALINDTKPIQDIESHINSLRELGADFSFTSYANRKWENNQLVDDPTIGEEVDE